MKITLNRLRKIIREGIIIEANARIDNITDNTKEKKIDMKFFYEKIFPKIEQYLPEDIKKTIEDKMDNYKEKESTGLSDEFLKEVLWKIISSEGARKDYNDLFKLDGGTVGIAHFANEGLRGLYEEMGDEIVKKYFGKYNNEINTVDSLKKATKRGKGYCRINKDGSSSDCWNSLKWWKQGMYDFVNDKNNNEIQVNAWLKSHGRPALNLAKEFSEINPEWSTKRGVAVMCCFVNSGGPNAGRAWSNNGKRSPNESIDWYAKNKAKRVRSRFLAINEFYPDKNFDPKFKPSAYSVGYSPKPIPDSYRKQFKPNLNKTKNENNKTKVKTINQ